MLHWIVWAIAALAASGLASWAARPKNGPAALLGAAGCLAAAVFGIYGAGGCLLQGNLESRRLVWNLPYAALNVGVDSLSALFLIPLFLVGAVVALYALRRQPGDYAANRPHEHWLFLNFTLAGAALALVARNAVLFLAAWEIMTVASFLLVENDQRRPGGRSGGWVYLSAGHIGCAALFALFALLGAGKGTLDFAVLGAAGTAAEAAFLLACAGFGGKIGLAPLQRWYPEAYPAAPAHAGAILSGVVGNMGVYGLLRVLSILGGSGAPPPHWWGYLLIAAGLGSGLIGAARSLAARDLSRILAWSSVENYGLMAAGIGLGLLGAASESGVVSFLGFTAAIIHMVSHSLSKALLFLAAGTVYARSGTRDIDRMGGLLKRLPATGFLFLVGALGAASVPPLNGFIGEFLLLMAAFAGAGKYHAAAPEAAAMFVIVAAVAVIGGLAVATCLKAFGFVFLGNPRGAGAVSTSPERAGRLLPHAILAAAAFALAALSPWALAIAAGPAARLASLWRARGAADDLAPWLSAGGLNTLDSVFAGCWLLAGCLALVFLLRRVVMRGAKAASGPTWDCGYAAPDNRMQYTASSFVRPVAESFHALVAIEDRESPPRGYFPASASFSSDTAGVERAWGFSHLFKCVSWIAAAIRVTQAGRVQIYLLYMAVALVVLLMWKL